MPIGSADFVDENADIRENITTNISSVAIIFSHLIFFSQLHS